MRRLIALLALCFSVGAFAQAYPTKPLRMIVPFPAGGPADIFGRGLAQSMASELGQPAVAEQAKWSRVVHAIGFKE